MMTEESIYFLKSPANGPGGGGHGRFVVVGVSGYLFIYISSCRIGRIPTPSHVHINFSPNNIFFRFGRGLN